MAKSPKTMKKITKRIARRIIVGNWKMNPGSTKEAKGIFAGIKKAASKSTKAKVVICPPYLHIPALVKAAAGSAVSIGAQDLFYKTEGSFTGAVSARMIADAGVGYVIVGHSERRKMGDDSLIVHDKLAVALDQGFMTILCVGETERDGHGQYLEVIKTQIKEALHAVDAGKLGHVIVAYEPVWAIGAKEAMQPAQIHEMTIYIKKVLLEKYPSESVAKVRILYGGSVTRDNAQKILTEGEVDGLLIGRQSLVPADLAEIISYSEAI